METKTGTLDGKTVLIAGRTYQYRGDVEKRIERLTAAKAKLLANKAALDPAELLKQAQARIDRTATRVDEAVAALTAVVGTLDEAPKA